MLEKINPVAKGLTTPQIRDFSNQVTGMADGVNLTIGEPDFPASDNVKNAGIAAIKDNLTSYSHNAGLLELRKEVSSFFKDQYNFYYQPETEIIITNGTSEGMDSLLRTILCQEDEVILPAPSYSAYESLIHLNGGKPVYLDTTDNYFKPDPARLESLITKKTKAIIFNYPSNPTGVTLDKEDMNRIVSVLKSHDIFVISDEIYSENTFKKDHISFAEYEELRDKLFLLHGLSKSHAMTGWRIGFLLGSEALMKHVLKVHLNNSICASLPGQYAAIEALRHNREAPAKMNEAYMERRDYIENRLKRIGLDVISPSGAFYIFPSIRSLNISSFDFATKLLNTKQVAVVPGSGFSDYGEGYIRISYASSLENIQEGMDRLESFVETIS